MRLWNAPTDHYWIQQKSQCILNALVTGWFNHFDNAVRRYIEKKVFQLSKCCQLRSRRTIPNGDPFEENPQEHIQAGKKPIPILEYEDKSGLMIKVVCKEDYTAKKGELFSVEEKITFNQELLH